VLIEELIFFPPSGDWKFYSTSIELRADLWAYTYTLYSMQGIEIYRLTGEAMGLILYHKLVQAR
jgi:hypothetical protein